MNVGTAVVIFAAAGLLGYEIGIKLGWYLGAKLDKGMLPCQK